MIFGNTTTPIGSNINNLPASYGTVLSTNNQNGFSFAQATTQNKQTLPCTIIQKGEDIKIADIPMTTPSLFIANDGSYVIGKEWNQQGGIETVLYVPYKPEQQAQPQQEQPVVQNDQQPQQENQPSNEYLQIMNGIGELTNVINNLVAAQTQTQNVTITPSIPTTENDVKKQNSNQKNQKKESEVTH